jgi:hypothetical protein
MMFSTIVGHFIFKPNKIKLKILEYCEYSVDGIQIFGIFSVYASPIYSGVEKNNSMKVV